MELFPLVSPILFAFGVTVLGFITPGYSHLTHTVSRLAIEKYGWIQSLNFFQLAIALYLTGMRLTDLIRKDTADKVIRTIFVVCSIFLIIAAFFPTDPIENVPLDLSLLSPTGLVHMSVVVMFLMLSPLGIISLANVFLREADLKRYAIPTLVAGFTAFFGSIVWFAFYFLGIYLEYRVIFQKAIAIPILIWLILINYAVIKKSHN